MRLHTIAAAGKLNTGKLTTTGMCVCVRVACWPAIFCCVAADRPGYVSDLVLASPALPPNPPSRHPAILKRPILTRFVMCAGPVHSRRVHPVPRSEHGDRRARRGERRGRAAGGRVSGPCPRPPPQNRPLPRGGLIARPLQKKSENNNRIHGPAPSCACWRLARPPFLDLAAIAPRPLLSFLSPHLFCTVPSPSCPTFS